MANSYGLWIRTRGTSDVQVAIPTSALIGLHQIVEQTAITSTTTTKTDIDIIHLLY